MVAPSMYVFASVPRVGKVMWPAQLPLNLAVLVSFPPLPWLACDRSNRFRTHVPRCAPVTHGLPPPLMQFSPPPNWQSRTSNIVDGP